MPIHLPKINPPNKIMGLAKPKRKTQITVKKMNNRLRIKLSAPTCLTIPFFKGR